eukprot:TRINITY_DN4417_c0_g1_i5.p1 TRINITY_DN4417_c0_g1~~TRINITY_DN4417_c0_g1_i5.p1  ORF type:complete len:412 (-),score=9.09 TRINITY_DN4417_c0_g1_i5:1479-2714(-)
MPGTMASSSWTCQNSSGRLMLLTACNVLAFASLALYLSGAIPHFLWACMTSSDAGSANPTLSSSFKLTEWAAASNSLCQDGQPFTQTTCEKALGALHLVQSRLGRALEEGMNLGFNDDLLMGLPPGALERMYQESVLFEGSFTDERIKQQVVATIMGAPTSLVSLGGSVTAGHGVLAPYTELIGQWWNSTFPHKANDYRNAGVGGCSGAAPLLCLASFLGPFPDIIFVEFNVNPTSEYEGESLFNAIVQHGERPAVITIEHFRVGWPFGQYVTSKSYGATAWVANFTNLSLVNNFTCLSTGRAVSPFWNGTIASPSKQTGSSPLREISQEKLFMYKHWRSEWDEVHPNALGHQLIATLITRHLISIVMHVNENHIIEFLTKTKVLETTLGTSFAQPALCNATAFSFLSKSR